MTDLKETGIIADSRYLEHDPGSYHVESPERLRAIYELFEAELFNGSCTKVNPRPATLEELRWNHTDALIKRVAATAGRPSSYLDPDTRTSEKSYETALLAVGGVFSLIDAVFQKKITNGFALVRPPGHHAEPDQAMGFCLFNNIALGAHYAIRRYGLERIMIVDWDIHHGNGTQRSFYDRSDVLYFSTHQFPYYPGTGNLTETGVGQGEGYTVNVPLPGGQGDDDFAAIFNHVLLPIASEYEPEIVFVSAGFDIYKDDPLGTMKMSENGFARLTRILMNIAERYCENRILLVLEGGYNVRGEKESVRAVLNELTGKDVSYDDYGDADTEALMTIKKVRQVQKHYWSSL